MRAKQQQKSKSIKAMTEQKAPNDQMVFWPRQNEWQATTKAFSLITVFLSLSAFVSVCSRERTSTWRNVTRPPAVSFDNSFIHMLCWYFIHWDSSCILFVRFRLGLITLDIINSTTIHFVSIIALHVLFIEDGTERLNSYHIVTYFRIQYCRSRFSLSLLLLVFFPVC